MENSEKHGTTIELGRKIADDLGANSRSDFMGGWMAHYIAELIDRYDNASGPKKEAIGDRIFSAIIKLWNHRYQMPPAFDAIKRGERILETLSRLDPEEKRPFYFFNHPPEIGEEGSNMEKLSELAMGVDRTARALLKTLLLVMTTEGTDGEAAKYISLVMPDHLTADLKVIGELKAEVESDDFSVRHQGLLQQVRDFGALCMEFGSHFDADQEAT